MVSADELGFDLDIETVRLLDAVITNIASDAEVKEEFKKLSFIKSLGNTYDETPGPIEQLLEKVARMEKSKYREAEDLYRLIGDVQHLAAIVEKQYGEAIITGTQDLDVRTRRNRYHTIEEFNEGQ